MEAPSPFGGGAPGGGRSLSSISQGQPQQRTSKTPGGGAKQKVRLLNLVL